MLDAAILRPSTCSLGPFVEAGEFLPCMALNGFLLRVAIEGTLNVLYVWDDEVEEWHQVAATPLIFRLSTVVPILDNYFYIQSLAEPVDLRCEF